MAPARNPCNSAPASKTERGTFRGGDLERTSREGTSGDSRGAARDRRSEGSARCCEADGIDQHGQRGARGRRARARGAPDGRSLPGARGAPHRGRRPGGAGRGGAARRGGRGARDLDGLAAALPEGGRQGRPADGGAGGRARETDRARRPSREAGDGRGEPPPRRLDREEVPQPGAAVPRPDPGGDDQHRERRVLELRYGLDGEHPRTLDEVGRTFNVTRERIRQIENQSLKKLRALADAQALKDVAA